MGLEYVGTFRIECRFCGSNDVEIIGGECIECGQEFWKMTCLKCGKEATDHEDTESD